MSAFGHVALVARSVIVVRNLAPLDAWNSAAAMVFPHSESNQEKGCPRGAFRGLCAAGLVVGVSASDKNEINTNGQYAIAAVNLLRANPSLRNQPMAALWRATLAAVGADVGKQHNGQMDVVLELVERNCIDPSPAQ
jgi:hypothetical protein